MDRTTRKRRTGTKIIDNVSKRRAAARVEPSAAWSRKTRMTFLADDLPPVGGRKFCYSDGDCRQWRRCSRQPRRYRLCSCWSASRLPRLSCCGCPPRPFSARTRTDISLVAALLLAPDGCQAPAICHERQQRVRNATVIAMLSEQDV